MAREFFQYFPLFPECLCSSLVTAMFSHNISLLLASDTTCDNGGTYYNVLAQCECISGFAGSHCQIGESQIWTVLLMMADVVFLYRLSRGQ